MQGMGFVNSGIFIHCLKNSIDNSNSITLKRKEKHGKIKYK